MSTGQTDYKAFRQRLDATLRQKDPAALCDFLVAEGQWQSGATNDAEAAMWMMIAASSALADLHDEAQRWLLSNGHEAEANAIFGRRAAAGGAPRHGARPAKNSSKGGASSRAQGARGHPSTPPSSQPPRTPQPQHSDRHPARDRQRPTSNPPKQPKHDPDAG
ncbi:MAG TPA: hypothetical protein VF510_08250 [Ktedonobacterales bacterium]